MVTGNFAIGYKSQNANIDQYTIVSRGTVDKSCKIPTVENDPMVLGVMAVVSATADPLSGIQDFTGVTLSIELGGIIKVKASGAVVAGDKIINTIGGLGKAVDLETAGVYYTLGEADTSADDGEYFDLMIDKNVITIPVV